MLRGQRDGPSAGGASRKVQPILPLDVENALEALWFAAEERTGPVRQKHAGRLIAGGQEAAKVRFVLQAWSFQILLSPQISGFKENQGRGSIHKCIKTNRKRALPVNEGKGPQEAWSLSKAYKS